MRYSDLISICIPAYNAEKYVAEALDSVLSQTYPHIEIIVVNDGSTDQTAGILKSYEPKGVKVIHQKNRGQCAAANAACRASTGQYIKFFDADDILSPNFIELQVQRLNGSNNYVASAEWARFYNDDFSTVHFHPEAVWQDMQPMDWLVTSMQNGGNMMQCALWLVPRAVLNRSGLWNERLSLINDFDFFIRVILASEGVRFTPGAKLYYRSGLKNSLSGQYSRKAVESALLSTQLGIQTILKTENSPRTRFVCADAYQLWAYNFYPHYPDLAAIAERGAQELGGSTMPIIGGKVLQILSQMLGWKKAKWLHNLAYNMGYKPMPVD